ncbi:MAG: hypothetical protein H6707_01535 [Deltaproteobacteria bacterium]|nr:hypothetical protein [Deltaproteobacteria bacterium]
MHKIIFVFLTAIAAGCHGQLDRALQGDATSTADGAAVPAIDAEDDVLAGDSASADTAIRADSSTAQPRASHGHFADPSPITVGGGASYVTVNPPPQPTVTVDGASPGAAQAFVQAVRDGKPSDVVLVKGRIDLSGLRDIEINTVVVGDRGRGDQSLLVTNDSFSGCEADSCAGREDNCRACNFLDLKDGAKLIGLTIRGPWDQSQRDHSENWSRGIRVGVSSKAELINCRIEQWGRVGVDVQHGQLDVRYSSFDMINVYPIVQAHRSTVNLTGSEIRFFWHAVASTGTDKQDLVVRYSRFERYPQPTGWTKSYGGLIMLDRHGPCESCSVDVEYSTFAKYEKVDGDSNWERCYDVWKRDDAPHGKMVFRHNVTSRGDHPTYAGSVRYDGSGEEIVEDNVVGELLKLPAP